MYLLIIQYLFLWGFVAHYSQKFVEFFNIKKEEKLDKEDKKYKKYWKLDYNKL